MTIYWRKRRVVGLNAAAAALFNQKQQREEKKKLTAVQAVPLSIQKSWRGPDGWRSELKLSGAWSAQQR